MLLLIASGHRCSASLNRYLLQRSCISRISFAFVALAIVFHSLTTVHPKLRRQVTITGGVVGLHCIQLRHLDLRCCRYKLTSHYLSIRCWCWDEMWCGEALLWRRLEEKGTIKLLLMHNLGGHTKRQTDSVISCNKWSFQYNRTLQSRSGSEKDARVSSWITPMADWAQAQEAQVCTTTLPPQCELQPHVYRSVSFFFIAVSFAHTQFQQLLRGHWLLLQRVRETEGLSQQHWTTEPKLDFCCYCWSDCILISISRKKTKFFFCLFGFFKKLPDSYRHQ